MHLSTAQIDRACGVLLASGVGDALGAGYEFGHAPYDGWPAMIGGGLGNFAPGEWTDDTAQAMAIATVAATGADLRTTEALDAVAASPTPVRWLVITAEPVTSVDVTAADLVAKLDETLQAAGIELCFAEMKDPVQDKLKRFGLFSHLGAEVFFPTIGEAVNTYLWTYPEVAEAWKNRDNAA